MKKLSALFVCMLSLCITNPVQGMKKNMFSKSKVMIWKFTKKNAKRIGIGVGAYYGVSYGIQTWLGIPSYGFLKEKVDLHVSAVKNYIKDAFNELGIALDTMQTKMNAFKEDSENLTQDLEDVHEMIDLQSKNLETAKKVVEDLETIAKNMQQKENELTTSIEKLIKAICQDKAAKQAILQEIDRRLEVSIIEFEDQQALEFIKEMINSQDALDSK